MTSTAQKILGLFGHLNAAEATNCGPGRRCPVSLPIIAPSLALAPSFLMKTRLWWRLCCEEYSDYRCSSFAFLNAFPLRRCRLHRSSVSMLLVFPWLGVPYLVPVGVQCNYASAKRTVGTPRPCVDAPKKIEFFYSLRRINF
jgi:hypothetical protein